MSCLNTGRAPPSVCPTILGFLAFNRSEASPFSTLFPTSLRGSCFLSVASRRLCRPRPSAASPLFLSSHNSSHIPHLTLLISSHTPAYLCVAGALASVARASSRSCCADCRRLNRGSSLLGRRSSQSLLKDLQLLFMWQAQWSEAPEGHFYTNHLSPPPAQHSSHSTHHTTTRFARFISHLSAHTAHHAAIITQRSSHNHSSHTIHLTPSHTTH